MIHCNRPVRTVASNVAATDMESDTQSNASSAAGTSNVIASDLDSDTESNASSANEAMYQADRSMAATMARVQSVVKNLVCSCSVLYGF